MNLARTLQLAKTLRPEPVLRGSRITESVLRRAQPRARLVRMDRDLASAVLDSDGFTAVFIFEASKRNSVMNAHAERILDTGPGSGGPQRLSGSDMTLSRQAASAARLPGSAAPLHLAGQTPWLTSVRSLAASSDRPWS